MWTSPITRALVRASSTTSWPAAAMLVGSGTRRPATTRSGYFFTAASIQSVSFGWAPPTPSSTTLRTLWRFLGPPHPALPGPPRGGEGAALGGAGEELAAAACAGPGTEP